MVLPLGPSEDGRGQWEREGSSVGLWNECAPEKTTCGAKAVCCLLVYDPTFYHLFSEPWIRMFFQVSGVFSSESGKKFAGLRSGTFSAQRRIQVYAYNCINNLENQKIHLLQHPASLPGLPSYPSTPKRPKRSVRSKERWKPRSPEPRRRAEPSAELNRSELAVSAEGRRLKWKNVP